jgi:G3E family GTPase
MSPLLLVAGFLGAGKTTFLRGLIPALAARGLRPRVVLNDFQNARVDAATLADILPELVSLDGDCVCCETFADLLDALAGLPATPGEVVVVETNGTTDTGVLLELLGGEARLDHLSPPLQLTVVDGQRFGRRGWQDTIEEEQIATATHLAISRRDLLDHERLQQVERALAALGPAARRTDALVLAEELAALERSLRPRGGRTSSGLAAPATAPLPERAHDHGARHFASLQVPLDGRIDEQAFLEFLRQLPPEILRAKGIVELTVPPGERRSFQKVDVHVEISPCQLVDPESLVPVAVFVGPSLPAAEIRARLGTLLLRS